jgi:uridylate kinase
MNQTIVISLGGSIIIPNEIDIGFLKKFRRILIEQVDLGVRVIIVTGGGDTSRRYYHAAKSIAAFSTDDLDRVGIAATRLNAELVRSLFGHHALNTIIIDPTKPIKTLKKIIVGAGWKPGRSTDYVACLLAKLLGASEVINVSNIDYVYTANPKIDKTAKPLPNLTWNEYLKLVPKKWSPRLSSPFDPVASRLAKLSGITVKIVNANRPINLAKAINGRKFRGTTIRA